MLDYYIFFIVLWLGAFIQFALRISSATLFRLLITFFFLFLSLRLDTGYDWPVYKQLYSEVGSIHTLSELLSFSLNEGKEPLFILLLFILNILSSNFQFAIFTISLIEALTLYAFLKRFSFSPAISLAIIGTWLVFTLYFSVLRQGLAVSFFLLSLTYWADNKKNKFYFYTAISISFQLSASLYYLLFYLSKIDLKNKRALLYLFSLCFIFSFYSSHISETALMLLKASELPIISSKAQYYLDRETTANKYDIFFVYAYSLSMFIFLYSIHNIHRCGIWHRFYFISFVFILFQLVFVDYPLLRNRLQYVAFPLQFMLITNHFYFKSSIFRFAVFSALLTTFLTYYALFLNRATSIVFIPYQNVVEYYLFDLQSDGDDRQSIMRNLIRK